MKYTHVEIIPIYDKFFCQLKPLSFCIETTPDFQQILYIYIYIYWHIESDMGCLFYVQPLQ